MKSNMLKSTKHLVSWCFEPSQPQKSTSKLIKETLKALVFRRRRRSGRGGRKERDEEKERRGPPQTPINIYIHTDPKEMGQTESDGRKDGKDKGVAKDDSRRERH